MSQPPDWTKHPLYAERVLKDIPPSDPILQVESMTEDERGLSVTARKIYCRHWVWPAYTCQICHPPVIAWWRRAAVQILDFIVGNYDRL